MVMPRSTADMSSAAVTGLWQLWIPTAIRPPLSRSLCGTAASSAVSVAYALCTLCVVPESR